MGTIIQWNVANWVTVILMVVLMYMAVATVTQVVKSKQSAA